MLCVGLIKLSMDWDKHDEHGLTNSVLLILICLCSKTMMTLLCCYSVDDMLITGNSSTQLDNFLCQLNKEFAMKDLGQAHYFFGIQIEITDSVLFLSQSRYAM